MPQGDEGGYQQASVRTSRWSAIAVQPGDRSAPPHRLSGRAARPCAGPAVNTSAAGGTACGGWHCASAVARRGSEGQQGPMIPGRGAPRWRSSSTARACTASAAAGWLDRVLEADRGAKPPWHLPARQRTAARDSRAQSSWQPRAAAEVPAEEELRILDVDELIRRSTTGWWHRGRTMPPQADVPRHNLSSLHNQLHAARRPANSSGSSTDRTSCRQQNRATGARPGRRRRPGYLGGTGNGLREKRR